MVTTDKKRYRFFTKEGLIAANEVAIAEEKNRSADPEKLKALDDDHKLIVVQAFPHNDVEFRLVVMVNSQGYLVVIDVDPETYLGLGIVEVDEEMSTSRIVADAADSGVPPNQLVGATVDDFPRMELIEGVLRCSECEVIRDEDAGPLYECMDCGTSFTRENSYDGDSHRCPDCAHFSSKVADRACSECGEGEVEEIAAFQHDGCDEYHESEDHVVECIGA